MMVSYKAEHPGHFKKAWFDAVALTNIMALGNVIQQCRVTYDSNEMMFVVHREPQKPNMEFRMHESVWPVLPSSSGRQTSQQSSCKNQGSNMPWAQR